MINNFWKRVQSWNPHCGDGFTLVELIVVIAILAILAGVAVPAYSGYIAKANKTTDNTLISDIVRAVELYNYSSNLTDSVDNDGVIGYVVVTQDSAVAEDGLKDASGYILSTNHMDKAMRNAFGDSYTETLRLKWDGWIDTQTILNQAANNPYAGSVNDSTYLNKIGAEQLLGDVQNCTSSLAGLLGNVGGLDWAQTLLESELGKDVFSSKLSAFGENETLSTEILANATVFAVADKILRNNEQTGAVIGSISEYGFVENMKLGTSTNIVDAANWYAALEALVSSMDDPDISAEFNALNNSMSSAASGSVDRGNVTGLMSNTQDSIFDIIEEKNLWDRYDAYYEDEVKNGKTQAQLDAEAYVGVMQSVNALEGDYVNNKEMMGNKELFGGGVLNDRVDSAIAAFSLSELIGSSDVLKQIANGNYSGASVVVIISVKNGVLTCDVCPKDASVRN